MPLIFRFMLAMATVLTCCEDTLPASHAFLPIGGSSLAELGFILAVAVVLYEGGAIFEEMWQDRKSRKDRAVRKYERSRVKQRKER